METNPPLEKTQTTNNPADSSKNELFSAKSHVVKEINTVEEAIYKKEEQRDYKMKSKK